jgi:hypothetical protein
MSAVAVMYDTCPCPRHTRTSPPIKVYNQLLLIHKSSVDVYVNLSNESSVFVTIRDTRQVLLNGR